MNRNAKGWIRAVAALGTLLGLAGCVSEPDVGKISVALRDGSHGAALPANMDTWVVTVSRIEIRADDGEDADEDMDDDGSWIVLRDTPILVDLTDLPNRMESLVEGAIVPTGSYSQLRLVIDGGYLVVDGNVFATADTEVPIELGEPGELRMPSMGTSGLKVKLPEDAVVTGDQHLLVLDFDLAQSLGHDSSEDVWVMHPVVEATDWLVSASLTVEVALADGVAMPEGRTLATFQAELVDANGEPIARAPLEDPEADGVFTATFFFVDPRLGPYTVRLVAPDGLTIESDPSPAIVDVDSGESLGISIDVTSVREN